MAPVLQLARAASLFIVPPLLNPKELAELLDTPWPGTTHVADTMSALRALQKAWALTTAK